MFCMRRRLLGSVDALVLRSRGEAAVAEDVTQETFLGQFSEVKKVARSRRRCPGCSGSRATRFSTTFRRQARIQRAALNDARAEEREVEPDGAEARDRAVCHGERSRDGRRSPGSVTERARCYPSADPLVVLGFGEVPTSLPRFK